MNKAFYFILLSCISYFSISGQDSLNMSRVGLWNPPNMPSTPGGNTYNDIWGYTATDGSEYAIIGNADSILVIDVSLCDDPQRVYGYDGGNTVIWRDFKVYQDYMYAVCDNCTEGLHIFNMSGLPNGNVSHELTTTAFFTKAHNIYIDSASHKLYAAGGNGASEGLTVLDLSTPADPTLIAHIEFDDELQMPSANFYVHDVFVQNDTAYCSHGYTGFYVWDLSNLNNIELLGSYDSPGYNHSSWIDETGSYSYYAEEVPRGRPMAVVDLENLGHPVNDIQLIHTFRDPISTIESDVTPHNPFVYEDFLYISYYEDGIKVYDLINPESPTLVAYYDTYPDNGTAYTDYNGNWGTYPFLSSGCILASDVKYGLNTLEVIPCPNPITYYRDSDDDTYGDPNTSYTGCAQADGWVTDNQDCDDDNDLINPNATEICDGLDNDCDGLTDSDDPDAVGNSTYYLDDDGDGFGSALFTITSCSIPPGYVVDNTDCDDNDFNNFPGNPEVCDGNDNNCDGQDDEGLQSLTYYIDADNDGYGNPNVSLISCSNPAGYVIDNTDCDDNDSNNFPGNPEVCDDNDNNCDGQDDEGLSLTYYIDADNDGYGNPNVSLTSCSNPAGYVTDNTDCDDNDSNNFPGNPEVCDGNDNNCDGQDDEGLQSLTYYIDADNDGYGNPNVSLISCSNPPGYVTDNTDCNDSNADINPNVSETCGDNIDNNCNNLIDENCQLNPCDSLNLYINPAAQNTYYAKQTISSDAYINSSQDIEYFAGQTIELGQGFEVVLGAKFLAFIKDCELAGPINQSRQDEK